MRSPLLAACALSVLSMNSSAGTNAPVTSVTLYPGSASITRTAQVAPGENEVVLAGLPANFNTQTMRVHASSGLRVGEVTTLDAAGSQALNPAEAALAAKIEALQDQKAVLDAEVKSATVVKNYLESYNGGGDDKPRPTVDAKALSGVIDTLGRGVSNALLKIQKLALQQRGLDKQIDVLQRDLARLQSGAKDTRAVSVRLQGDKGGTVTVSYQLNNAGWKPGYRASLDSSASTVELARMATVAQSTGEDWSNVKLTLSTSQPRQSPVGREAQPWLLSWRPHQPAAYAQDMVKAAPPPAPMAERVVVTGSRARADNEVDKSLMSEVQGTFATEFEVPGRVNLASDGRQVTLSLSTQMLAAKQHLRVTPRLERFAIVMAETARPDGVWPQGNLQLFRDGSYVGATHWNLQEGKRAEFAFGRDDLLKVSVDAVDGMAGSKGLFGSRASHSTADVFTLTSRHKKPMDIVVIESSPVSTSEEIKVAAKFAPQPSVEKWDERRGVVAWKTTLAPAATAKFNVEYKIDYPKEGEMLGLR